jgi:outer membrane protein assembly factor BamB
MHDIEQNPTQDDTAVEITDLSPQKEDTSRSVEKDSTTAGRQKLTRAWRYIIIGTSVLLVLALVFAGVLSLAKQGAKQSPVTETALTSAATTIPTPTTGASTIRATTLPTPASTPIPSPAFLDNNVNVTIANGVAYLSTNNNGVYALRMSNGSLLWSHKIDGSAARSPLVANGIVYVISYAGQNGPAHVYALRSSDGSLLWHYDNANYSYMSLSTSDSNVVYVASQDGISALEGNNGTRLWHYDTKGNTSSTLPQEVNGIVYFSSSIDNGPGMLYALRVSDGTPIWHYTTTGYIDTPTVTNDMVFIDSNGGKLAALRVSDGQQIWKQTYDGYFIQSPQLVNGVLYITSTKIVEPPAAHSANPLQAATDVGTLLWNTLQSALDVPTIPSKEGISSVYAVRASDGATLWHYALNGGANSWANWLSVENGVVYASDAIPTNDSSGAGDIYALQSNNGSVLWHDKLKASPTNALLANGVIYLSTSSDIGAVYAVHANDGSLLWNYPIAGSMYPAPVLDGNVVCVGATNGMVYALRANNGGIVWHYLTQVGG